MLYEISHKGPSRKARKGRGFAIAKRREIHVDAILDIEAGNWTTFVLGGLYFSNGVYQEYWWDREKELVEQLTTFQGSIWAHFGGGYDYKWLIDWLASMGITLRPVNAGSRVVYFRVNKANFYDSFALVPISLEKFTKGMGVEKVELGLDCTCGKRCGGYCRISRTMPEADKKKLSEYLRLDCMSLMTSLKKLQSFAAENDFDLGATVGSSAWRNVRRKLGVETAKIDGPDYDFIREAYFGGRVQTYRRGMVPRGWEHDVNSMYPYCLTMPVPVGEWRRSIGREAHEMYCSCMSNRDGMPGFYRAIVDVPEMFIPPLPHRFNNNLSISYPFGRFEGTWSLPELKHAESVGVGVTILESITWEEERPIFKDWVLKGWDVRSAAPVGGKSGPIGTWVKFLLNSMIGKMGSNPLQEKFEINPPLSKIKLCDCNLQLGEECDAGHYRRLSEYVYVHKEIFIQDCAHIEWAAYCISRARVRLHQFQLINGGWDMVYSDTDSCYRTSDIEAYLRDRSLLMYEQLIGDELGQWQAQGPFRDFIAVAPKVYSYLRDKDGKESLTAKAKGIEIPTEKIGGKKIPLARPEPGQSYRKEGVIGFKAGASIGEFFVKRDITRKLNERSGDRLWMQSLMSNMEYPEGVTFPPHIDDLKP